MKAEELIVGDYVKYTTPPYIKVASITKKKIGYHIKPNEPRMHYVRLCEVTPIPLTDEILEKNGFVLKEGGMGMYGVTIASHYIREDLPFEVFCDGEPFAVWFKDPVNIKYVHQLQHAMRLCNINKTIEL